jgi:hypothetical protein
MEAPARQVERRAPARAGPPAPGGCQGAYILWFAGVPIVNSVLLNVLGFLNRAETGSAYPL